MKRYLSILVPWLLVACGGESPSNDGSRFNSASSAIYFDDVGYSNRLLSCNRVSEEMILSDFQLGMSNDQIRAIAGKPRHISALGDVWRFGDDREPRNAEPIGGSFFHLPTVQMINALTIGFSHDNTLCDDTEISFIEAANALVDEGVQSDASNEHPACFDAALRIAARVEQGMSTDQILKLVGRPVEVTSDGIWRYEYGKVRRNDFPKIYFELKDVSFDSETSSVETSTGRIEVPTVGSYVVAGYSSNTSGCFQ